MSDDTLPLFPDEGGPPPYRPPAGPASNADSAPSPAPRAERQGLAPSMPGGAGSSAPLAERMRPRTLDEVVGQEKLLGEGGVLRRLLDGAHLPSLILTGPPGSGKTTLARLLAASAAGRFVPFSAVSEGVPRLREIVKEAERDRRVGRKVVLFVDEIHRLNKGQQDFLLPFVESGLLTLIGATTEHPGFEVNAALLSRARVLVLEPLSEADLRSLIRRALADPERGLGAGGYRLDEAGEDAIVRGSSGDARQALVTLEIAAQLAGEAAEIDGSLADMALQRRISRYDTTTGFQMLSAFHKSLRASDGDAALYWGMRMVRAGEDPTVLFRRLVAAAYEDVGLADPQAGVIATQALQAWERLGAPEGFLPLANAVLYVAAAPKSNRAYLALGAARAAADRVPDAPVPLHLRNASTSLMREWGYKEGYRYAHDFEEGYAEMQCLPDELAGERFYEPTDRGTEARIAQRMRERGQLGDG